MTFDNMTFEGIFNSEVFKGYLEENLPQYEEGLAFAQLFPVMPIDGLEFSYIKGANGAIELASPSAYDAEPITQHRKGFDAMKGELPLFRKKMDLSEKEKSLLKLYIQANKNEAVVRLMSQIFNDQATLVQGSLMTQEFLRARALMDGKINIESKGGAVSFDYKVPVTHKFTLSGAGKKWSDPEAKILDDIIKWCDTVETDTGFRPAVMVLNRTTFQYLKNNKQIKGAAFPMGAINVPINTFGMADSTVIEAIKNATGLTDIVVYNRKVQLDGKLLDLVEDNKVAIVPAGALGETMIGTSPAEINMEDANKSGANISILSNGLAVNTYTNFKAPYTSGTEIEWVGLPSFPTAGQVVLATVDGE